MPSMPRMMSLWFSAEFAGDRWQESCAMASASTRRMAERRVRDELLSLAAVRDRNRAAKSACRERVKMRMG